MAWETRCNRSYFYRKERIGGRIRSIYVGSGELAALIEQCEKGRRIEREFEANATKEQRNKAVLIDEQINDLSEINRSLVDALFLINGYHQHKRQWRKKWKPK